MKAIEAIKTEGIKGFMKRWKEGMTRITPLQEVETQLTFTCITLRL